MSLEQNPSNHTSTKKRQLKNYHPKRKPSKTTQCYDQHKKQLAEEYKRESSPLGTFILDKIASPKVNFSKNPKKRFWEKYCENSVPHGR